jgi:hypothetical protein
VLLLRLRWARISESRASESSSPGKVGATPLPGTFKGPQIGKDWGAEAAGPGNVEEMRRLFAERWPACRQRGRRLLVDRCASACGLALFKKQWTSYSESPAVADRREATTSQVSLLP